MDERNKLVRFEFQIGSGCEVYLAGSFNGWNPQAIRLRPVNDDGLCRVMLPLSPGRHEYKFVVNGTWITDPRTREIVSNGLGDHNSVVVVH